MTILFNKATITDADIALVHEAIANGHISGTGPFTKRCEAAIQDRLGAARALLTTSCTHALEMSALLCNLQPGE
jgi:dTDP-4-amino-4,6-dideoxygalactose transaminase